VGIERILRYLADAMPRICRQDACRAARRDKWMDWQFSFADAQRGAFLQMVRVARDSAIRP
jgi:glutathione S-transferase